MALKLRDVRWIRLARNKGVHVATQVSVDAQSIARQFAAAIRGIPGSLGLWVRPDRDHIDLVLLTEAIDDDTERSLFRAVADLIAEYPAAGIRLDVLNPDFYEEGTDLMMFVPRDAAPIALCG